MALLRVRSRKTKQVETVTDEQWNVLRTMFPGTFELVTTALAPTYSELAQKIIDRAHFNDEEE